MIITAVVLQLVIMTFKGKKSFTLTEIGAGLVSPGPPLAPPPVQAPCTGQGKTGHHYAALSGSTEIGLFPENRAANQHPVRNVRKKTPQQLTQQQLSHFCLTR